MANNNNFNLILAGTFSTEQIKSELAGLSGKLDLVVNLKFNNSAINAQLQRLIGDSSDSKISSKIYKSDNKLSPAKGLSGTLYESTRIAEEYATGVNKVTTTLNEQGKATSKVVEITKDLNNTTRQYYKISASGEREQLLKVIEVENTGYKEQLKLKEKNNELAYKIENSIKAYRSQTKLTAKETATFNNRLSETYNIQDEISRNKALKELNTDIRTASESVGILGQSFTKAATKYVTWLGIATIVAQITRAFSDMINEVHILDDALVELSKVTDLTDKGLENVKNQAFTLGEQLGRTGDQVLTAITEFARAGYELQDSIDLAEVAITLTNVAENITDTGEAANYLISILKGANLEISQAGLLLDQLNEVSNNFAVDLGTLADMVQRITGTMSNFGVSVEETMALVTGAYEVLQDERVARGVSTIAARIAGLNENLEVEEGLSNQVTEALEKYANIDVFDLNGQLRNTYDILEELAGKWDHLSTNAQSVLLNIVAGKNRMDVLSAILTNWEGVSASLEATTEAEGSAAAEQAAYLESITGKTQQLANAWQELADTTINSDFIKWLVDAAKWVVNLANSWGGLINTLATFVGIISAFKFSQFIIGLKNGTIAIEGLSNAMSTATTTMSGLKASITAIGGVVGIIGGVGSIIMGIISAVKQAREAEELARQERIKGIEEDITATQELQDKYLDLKTSIEDSEELNKELASSYEQLAKMAKAYGVALEDVNGAQKDYTELTQDVLGEQYKQWLAENRDYYEDALAFFNELDRTTVRIGARDPTIAKNIVSVLQNAGFSGLKVDKSPYVGISFGGTIEEQLKTMTQLRDYLEGLDTSTMSGQYQKVYASFFDNLVSQISELNKEIQEQQDIITKFEETQFQLEFLQSGQAQLNKITEQYKEWAKGTQQEMAQEATSLLEQMDNTIKSLIEQYPQYEDAIKEMFSEMREDVESAMDFDVVLTALEEKKQALEAQKELDQEELKTQEKLLEVEKAREELARAQMQRVRVFRAGQGFVYETDASALQSAQESLQDTLSAAGLTDVDQAISNIDTIIDAYNNGLLAESETGQNVIREYFLNAENYANFFASSFAEKMKILAGLGAVPSTDEDAERESLSGYLGTYYPSVSNLPSSNLSMLSKLNGRIATNAISNSSNIVFNGSLNFPNVQSSEDAEGFINSILNIRNYKI